MSSNWNCFFIAHDARIQFSKDDTDRSRTPFSSSGISEVTVLCENVESRRKDKAGSAGFKAGLSEVNRFLNVALKRLLLKAYKKGLSAVLREKTLIKGQRGHEN